MLPKRLSLTSKKKVRRESTKRLPTCITITIMDITTTTMDITTIAIAMSTYMPMIILMKLKNLQRVLLRRNPQVN
jgi:hypothetical protein